MATKSNFWAWVILSQFLLSRPGLSACKCRLSLTFLDFLFWCTLDKILINKSFQVRIMLLDVDVFLHSIYFWLRLSKIPMFWSLLFWVKQMIRNTLLIFDRLTELVAWLGCCLMQLILADLLNWSRSLSRWFPDFYRSLPRNCYLLTLSRLGLSKGRCRFRFIFECDLLADYLCLYLINRAESAKFSTKSWRFRMVQRTRHRIMAVLKVIIRVTQIFKWLSVWRAMLFNHQLWILEFEIQHLLVFWIIICERDLCIRLLSWFMIVFQDSLLWRIDLLHI